MFGTYTVRHNNSRLVWSYLRLKNRVLIRVEQALVKSVTTSSGNWEKQNYNQEEYISRG